MNLETQYDRLLNELKVEVKELYWLYNFFFIVNGALLSYAYVHSLNRPKIEFFLTGLFLSCTWLLVFHKQRVWRDSWIIKIKNIQSEIGVPQRFQMFSDEISANALHAFLHYGGIARTMYLLPIGFIAGWTLYFYNWLEAAKILIILVSVWLIFYRRSQLRV